MAVQTATILKSYFNTGDTPTEVQFADLIDSSVNTGLLDETAHGALDHTGLTGIPAAYSLPTASTTVLGGVKVDGTTVTITDGVISSSGSSMTNPMTTAGDIIYGGTSGAPTRLAKGTDGQVLTLASGLPSWAAASGGSLLVAETVVSGSAVTSVTFSGLDGNAAGGYVLIGGLVKSGSEEYLNCQINSIATGYDVVVRTNGSAGRNSNATGFKEYFYGASGDRGYIIAEFIPCDTYQGAEIRSYGRTNDNTQRHVSGYVAATNITSIAVVGGTSGIGVGTTFRLYRRK